MGDCEQAPIVVAFRPDQPACVVCCGMDQAIHYTEPPANPAWGFVAVAAVLILVVALGYFLGRLRR